MLRPGMNMLRPGGAQYCLEEHCGLQEHSTVWKEHATAWRDTVLSGGTLRSAGTFYGLGGTCYGLEGHSTVWRNTAVYRNTLRPRRNTLRSGGTYDRLEDLCLLQRRINTNTNCGCYKVHQGVSDITVNPERCRVRGAPHSVLCCTFVHTTVLHSHPADVDVTDDITSNGHVLPNHKPVPRKTVLQLT